MLKRETKLGYIGLPCEVGACFRGSALAPDAMRQFGLLEKLRGSGYALRDWGNVNGPVFKQKDYQKSGQLLAENIDWTKLILQKTQAIYEAGEIPIAMGGDHAIAMGTIMAARQAAEDKGQPLHVLWIDAHGDFNTPQTSQSGHIHGMPLAVVCGQGHTELLQLSPFLPVLAEKNVTLVGIRDLDQGEIMRLKDAKIYQGPMGVIHEEGLMPFINRAIARAKDAGAHFHISFDVDGLDAQEAPATGTPVANGITVAQLTEAFHAIKESNILASLDVVELNPRIDAHHDNKTIKATKALIEALFI